MSVSSKHDVTVTAHGSVRRGFRLGEYIDQTIAHRRIGNIGKTERHAPQRLDHRQRCIRWRRASRACPMTNGNVARRIRIAEHDHDIVHQLDAGAMSKPSTKTELESFEHLRIAISPSISPSARLAEPMPTARKGHRSIGAGRDRRLLPRVGRLDTFAGQQWTFDLDEMHSPRGIVRCRHPPCDANSRLRSRRSARGGQLFREEIAGLRRYRSLEWRLPAMAFACAGLRPSCAQTP